MTKSPTPIKWTDLPQAKRRSSPLRRIQRRIKRYMLPIAVAVAVIIAVSVVIYSTLQNKVASPIDSLTVISGDAMGSVWIVKIPNRDLHDAHLSQKQLKTDVDALLAKLNSEMSLWNPSGELSKFNDNVKSDWIEIPAEMAELITRSLLLSEKTDGAFDITVAPLVFLWGFGPPALNTNLGIAPSLDRIERAKTMVGYRNLQCQNNPPGLRKFDPAVQIDLGGIAKGYAVDKVAAYLELLPIKNYLISIGGELQGKGDSPEGPGWRVGIQIPATDTRKIFRPIILHNQCLSTSGDYNNILTIDGKTYSHLINPQTGMAMECKSSSVSEIASDSTTADALATAFFVLGKDRALQLAPELKAEALFIWKGKTEFETAQTAGFPK